MFRGEYKNGTRNGQGTYTFASGAVYEGSYADSKRSGYGVFKSPDGSSYSGVCNIMKFNVELLAVD